MARQAMIMTWLLGVMAGALLAADRSHTGDVQQHNEAQQARARELIQRRAAKESRDRQARIESRKRAGISLLRPNHGSPNSHVGHMP